jgi:hypothetical protein
MGSVPILQFFKSPHATRTATLLAILTSKLAVQAATLQYHWPLSLSTLQYKVLQCNSTDHSQFKLCSTRCCIATALTTLIFNSAVQDAAMQQHWPLSLSTLQYKVMQCNSTDHSPFQPCSTRCCIATALTTLSFNSAVQGDAMQQHWPISRPTFQSLPNSRFYLYVCLAGNEWTCEFPNSLYIQGSLIARYMLCFFSKFQVCFERICQLLSLCFVGDGE